VKKEVRGERCECGVLLKEHPVCDGCGMLAGFGHLQQKLNKWEENKKEIKLVCDWCFAELTSDRWEGRSWKTFQEGLPWRELLKGPLKEIIEGKPYQGEATLKELIESFYSES